MTADPLFYEIFKEIPELFFELIGQPGQDPSIYKFSALEIKQRGFGLDGLLSTLEAYPMLQSTLLKLNLIKMIISTTSLSENLFFI